MRITAEAKARTRARILTAAAELFGEHGFAATSTRDLATAAGIAAGTLFNYFPSKEALGLALLADGLDRGQAAFEAARRGDESLDELLFAHIAAGLREVAPCRAFAGQVFEAALGLFQPPDAVAGAADLRARHLQVVHDVLSAGGTREAPGAVALHLYWTLYLGVLAFWSNDDSPGQEDTLAVLDESMKLFVTAL